MLYASIQCLNVGYIKTGICAELMFQQSVSTLPCGVDHISAVVDHLEVVGHMSGYFKNIFPASCAKKKKKKKEMHKLCALKVLAM